MRILKPIVTADVAIGSTSAVSSALPPLLAAAIATGGQRPHHHGEHDGDDHDLQRGQQGVDGIDPQLDPWANLGGPQVAPGDQRVAVALRNERSTSATIGMAMTADVATAVMATSRRCPPRRGRRRWWPTVSLSDWPARATTTTVRRARWRRAAGP